MPSRAPRAPRGPRSARETIPVDALLAEHPPTHTAIAERLRRIVLDAVPEAIERVRPGWRLIGYDLPIRRHGVFFAWIWVEPEHVHLGFPRGVLMDDPDEAMQGAGVTKLARWLTYEPGAAVEGSVETALVLEAARVAVIPRSVRS
jgi:hypothetical protein